MAYTCKIKPMLLFSSFKKSEFLKIAFSLETKLNFTGEKKIPSYPKISKHLWWRY